MVLVVVVMAKESRRNFVFLEDRLQCGHLLILALPAFYRGLGRMMRHYKPEIQVLRIPQVGFQPARLFLPESILFCCGAWNVLDVTSSPDHYLAAFETSS